MTPLTPEGYFCQMKNSVDFCFLSLLWQFPLGPLLFDENSSVIPIVSPQQVRCDLSLAAFKFPVCLYEWLSEV